MSVTRGRPRDAEAHERLLAAAYDLFRLHGTRSVGVDAICARSGVSKMTLYRHFQSKEALVAEFMRRREQMWTIDWFKSDVCRRAPEPEGRLLATFDVLDAWIRSADFDGCPFVNAVIEYPPEHVTHIAAREHLAVVRAFFAELAREAGIKDPKAFAEAWHMMMKGATIAAQAGNRAAGRKLKSAARVFLASQLPKNAKKIEPKRTRT